MSEVRVHEICGCAERDVLSGADERLSSAYVDVADATDRLMRRPGLMQSLDGLIWCDDTCACHAAGQF